MVCRFAGTYGAHVGVHSVRFSVPVENFVCAYMVRALAVVCWSACRACDVPFRAPVRNFESVIRNNV